MDKAIAIVIHNLILFETLEPLLKRFDRDNLDYDIIIPVIDDDLWGQMAKDTYSHLTDIGYKVQYTNVAPDIDYKIALYPYLPYYIEVRSKYKVRYQYGMAKANWNLDTWGVHFDLTFCNSPYDQSFLSAYNRTVITGMLKYADFKEETTNRINDKKTLLYLPTYGDLCSIEKLYLNLHKLAHKYNIIVKLHHGTSYLEKKRVELAKEISGQIYDHRTPLIHLLKETDLIISDGSGAIFDALFTGIPVVIYQNQIPERFENIPTLEEEIVINQTVPAFVKPDQLSEVIDDCINNKDYKNRAELFRKQYFPVRGEQSIEVALSEIKKLLYTEGDPYYHAAHNRLSKHLYTVQQKESETKKEIDELTGFSQQLVNEKNTLMDDKMDLLNSIKNLLEEKQNTLIEISQLHFQIQQSFSEKQHLNNENLQLLNEKKQLLDEKKQLLNDKKQLLDEKQHLIEMRQEKQAEFQGLIEAKELELVSLHAQLSEYENNYLALQEKAKNIEDESILREQKINELSHLNQHYNNELNNIYGSKRWKLVNRLKRIMEKSKLIYLFKAYSIWKQYGLSIMLKKAKNKLFKTINNKHEDLRSNQDGMLNWYQYKFANFKHLRSEIYPISLDKINIPQVAGLVSIVLPVYNGEDMIRDSIQSVLNQTYTNFELIIINDGSTDSTPEILNEFSKLDSRITVIHQENRRIPRTLSRGFRIAKGEFFTWTSADNNMHADFIEKMVKELKNDVNLGMVYANMRLIDEKGEVLRNHWWYEEPKGSGHVKLPSSTLELNVFPNNTIGAAFMYRAKAAFVLEDYSEYRHTLEDYDYWMRMNSLFKLKHTKFEEPIYDYRFHSKSLTSQDKELGITANRYKLMVLDDFRRDFYLSPNVWLLDGDNNGVINAFKEFLKSKNQVIVEMEKLESLVCSELGIPYVYVHVTEKIKNEIPYESILPKGTYTVQIDTSKKMSQIQETSPFDLNIVIGDQKKNLKKLSDYKGWVSISDYDTLTSFVDAKLKNRILYKIEGEIERINQTSDDKNLRYKLSVIICTYKRTEKLNRALLSIIEQSMSKDEYEIVVVNNDFENDEVFQLIYQLKNQKFHNLKYVVSPIKGLSFARNTGMFEATGEVLLFLDDDIIADSELLEETWRSFDAHPDAGVIGGSIILKTPKPMPEVIRPGTEAYWSQFIISGDDYQEANYQWEFPYGANFGVRKSVLMRIGGFRTSYGRKGNDFSGGEEIVASYLIKEVGYKIGLNPKAKVWHDVDDSRFSKEHVQKTMRASILTHYRLQKDLYSPMESDIQYDLQQIDIIEKEIEILNSNHASNEENYDILYKVYLVQTYRELISMKQKDLEERKRLASCQ